MDPEKRMQTRHLCELTIQQGRVYGTLTLYIGSCVRKLFPPQECIKKNYIIYLHYEGGTSILSSCIISISSASRASYSPTVTTSRIAPLVFAKSTPSFLHRYFKTCVCSKRRGPIRARSWSASCLLAEKRRSQGTEDAWTGRTSSARRPTVG